LTALAGVAATVDGRTADERTYRVATTKRQTMSKMNRERELKEKRAMKQERKDEKKLAAAAAAAIEAEPEAEAPVAPPSA
jgi:hypothetical protein